MLKQTQSQKQIQKLIPQIIQKQNLLAVPTISLEQIVKQELEQNPFLEEVEELTDSQEEATDEKDSEDEVLSEESEKPAVEEDIKIESTSKDDEEFDTDDYVDSDIEGYKAYDDNFVKEKINYENIWSSKITLKDNLLSQLHLLGLPEKDMLIGEEIIWSLDDEGYFKDNPEEIITDLEKQKDSFGLQEEKFTAEDFDKVLKIVQTLEPVGIASRTLSECLLTQLNESDLDKKSKSICIDIITNHFEEFRLKNYEKLMKVFNIGAGDINVIFGILSKLNPKPGYSSENSDSFYIYPDIIIYNEEGEFKVELNDRSIPSLRLNDMYNHLMKTGDKQAKDFIKNNLERAKWFLESLRSRKETLLKVMYAILYRQTDFFEQRGKNLKPMLEKEIAEDIGMDISTVSRTVRGKYVQTDFGIFELKHFFSYHIKNNDGNDVSTREVKVRISDLIENENHSSPYTDDDLVNELKKHGFKIARRTVAKYRESLKIPVARLRRKV
ncbi:MAG: RNA polymerase factor sigma-54 [Ignavibacteria bacterium]|nr:RNA polymerase factor sigma-54 [Ignavibacteria bacterium]